MMYQSRLLGDEIGKMEWFAPTSIDAMRRLFHSDRIVIATIAARGGGFIAEAKAWPGATIQAVTRASRDSAPAEIDEWIRRSREGNT